MNYCKRGNIFYVNDAYRSIGSEQKAGRPAIIVSNDTNNKNSEVYEVVFLTTQPKADLPTHFITNSALRPSTVLCEQINSISADRIGAWVGMLTLEEMEKLNKCLAISIDIKQQAEAKEERQEEIGALRQQVATYKEMYEFLLKKRMGV